MVFGFILVNLKSLPSFPPNSTHAEISLGQNRVTERKEALQPESDLAFRETQKGESNYEQQ